MSTSSLMPATAVGHGSPMNALETNRYTTGWSEYAATVPAPRAILAISAHWYVNAAVVTAMAAPPTIHDFYGFPEELFAYQYPAPGAPDLAGEIAEIVKPIWIGQDRDSWGLDHGTWSVLAHMFPGAQIPVVQLSIDATKSFEDHVALGAALAPLRQRGVLVVASGNVVHNLRAIQWNLPDAGEPWAVAFDDAAREVFTTNPGDAASLAEHPHFRAAAPTPDHFIPFLYTAGLAAAAGTTLRPYNAGCAMGSLSMTSYALN